MRNQINLFILVRLYSFYIIKILYHTNISKQNIRNPINFLFALIFWKIWIVEWLESIERKIEDMTLVRPKIYYFVNNPFMQNVCHHDRQQPNKLMEP